MAVGRTPDVSGQLDVTGTVIENFAIKASLTSLAIRRRCPQRRHPAHAPDGRLSDRDLRLLPEPVDLGQVHPEGEVFALSVPGTLTIMDISQDVVVDLEAGRSGDTVVVVGTWPIQFADFEVTMPSAPIVVSVSEDGELKWRLLHPRRRDGRR